MKNLMTLTDKSYVGETVRRSGCLVKTNVPAHGIQGRGSKIFNLAASFQSFIGGRRFPEACFSHKKWSNLHVA